MGVQDVFLSGWLAFFALEKLLLHEKIAQCVFKNLPKKWVLPKPCTPKHLGHVCLYGTLPAAKIWQ